MKLKIVQIGRPVLRRKASDFPSRPAGKALRGFLRSMVETMRAAQGVGLAANQVDRGRRAFVMECRGNRRYPGRGAFPLQAYLNARIVKKSKARVWDWEGCLSIPGYRGLVPRAKTLVLEALTPEGKKIRRTFRGFEARVIQHEVDHLDGFFYIDRMEGKNSFTGLEAFNKRFRTGIRDKKK
jgi:peptide deformylase